MNGTMTAAPHQQPLKPRYGCFPAKIGFDFQHKLEHVLELPSGRKLAAGTMIVLTVQDISRHPEADAHVAWRCSHPECAGKRWPTKKELVAAHKGNRDLERLEEAHLFMGVAYVPGAPAKEEKRGKHGEVQELGEPARAPKVLLLSDEE